MLTIKEKAEKKRVCALKKSFIERQEKARKNRIRRERMKAQKEGQVGRTYLKKHEKVGLTETQQENLRLWVELGVHPDVAKI